MDAVELMRLVIIAMQAAVTAVWKEELYV